MSCPAQVMQSNFSSNTAINGAGVSVQQVTSMSMFNVSVVVSSLPALPATAAAAAAPCNNAASSD